MVGFVGLYNKVSIERRLNDGLGGGQKKNTHLTGESFGSHKIILAL